MDISSLEKIEKSNITIFDDIDASAIKELYDNCIRIGGTNNNVEIATVHPSLWFEDFLKKFSKNIKIVTSMPAFSLCSYTNGQFSQTNYFCDTFKFNEKEFDRFAEDNKFKNFAIFYVNKCVDLKTSKVSWILRYKDITTLQESRALKIESIIKT